MANLDPQAKAYLEAFYQGPLLQSMEPQAVRDLFAQMPPVEIELAPLAKVEDRQIPVGENEEIGIRVYTPEGQGPFPIFVYYHGGGWVIGDLETVDASCREIANQTNSVVVSVDYRLAPEYKFPTPVKDSYAALQWVSENADSINGNASNIVVGGDSAGGNLSAVMSLLAREQNGPEISAQVLIYPVTSLDFNTKSYEEFKEGYGLDKDLMIWFGDYYINNEEDKKNVLAAPLLAADLSNLPPAFVITAENDVLRDEGMAYAKRLREAGVEVEEVCEKGLIHGYFTNMAVFPERIKGTISSFAKFLDKVNSKVKNP
ncbi:alpha/beta hydrolase [Bacillus thermotolerans]|uniref:Esterase/lipase n=1 Tax=Bacillus thermotolerans TaxID=1221996 RepID=A0A0F5I7B9_BACTR|nr:alpha/beta hydrolase [Bacillus thermotolerans]KKB38692.1 Esterase/lipase [Bacillus thermotolerans]KKB41431.1 Esterase/lipase [Bacillus thermotolerans]